MLKIEYDNFSSEEHKLEIEDYFNKISTIPNVFPAYVDCLYISFTNVVEKKEDEEELHASFYIDEFYLRAYIKIYPLFFEQSKEEKIRTLCHEVAHMQTQLLYLAGLDAAKFLPKKSRKLIQKSLLKETEKTACYIGKFIHTVYDREFNKNNSDKESQLCSKSMDKKFNENS